MNQRPEIPETRIAVAILLIALGAALIACAAPEAASTATAALPSATASATMTATQMHTATATHTATPTSMPTATPTSMPTATFTPTPTPTLTATPTQTPTPTPTPARRLEMIYQIEHPTVFGQEALVEQLWIPLPNDDGDGTRDVELLEVYPEGHELQDIGEANRAAYWGNVPDLCARTDCRFGIRFRVTLERPQYAIPWRDAIAYDTESELYATYTQPARGIQSDDPVIRDLARQIVGEEKNAYKQVLLLQSWLQQNVLYTNQISGPPSAQACLAAREGDCAGQSMLFVALCRALGIPARTVSGLRPFARGVGQLDQFPARIAWYESTLDMHVWVEVYFPDLGWVQCEPNLPGFGLAKERLITMRGPFAFQGGLCRPETYFHLPLSVWGDQCGKAIGWEVSIDSRLVE